MSVSSKYQKLTQIEHVLKRPDTYVGSLHLHNSEEYIIDENDKIQKKTIQLSDAALKVFDEILVNARDRLVESGMKQKCDIIKVSIENNCISVYNNGDGIPIEIHEKENVYIPQLIFGSLLTSSNYDDSKKRTAGGRNGYGAKLTNIFSKSFEIETLSGNQKYYQKFENNLSIINKPKITKCSKKEYTKIIFELDVEKFGMNDLSKNFISLLKRRTYDIAATIPSSCNNKVKVYFQDKLIQTNSFDKYIQLYYPDEKKIYEIVNDRWKVGVIFKPYCEFQQISYVNSIFVKYGGTHVSYVIDQITRKISEILKTKHKLQNVKANNIKEHLIIFIDCLIENPSFKSQTKEELTTKSGDFGSKCILSDKFIDKILKTNIINLIKDVSKFKDKTLMAKSDGKKVSRIKDLPKLEDANFAGTNKSSQCSLILTEGDSAKASAIAGLSIVGKDCYGVFPLKGKLLNVRDASPNQLLKNEEIQNIKKILGLKQGSIYKNTNELRYGKGIIIFTDQDYDGFHIKGLLMNFIHYFWPDLIFENKNFIRCLTTPIVKAFYKNQEKIFYTNKDYNDWSSNISNLKNWKIKYYKGLGTSTPAEAKSYFKDISKKLINYKFDDKTDESLKKAFSKEKSDDRKKWLIDYNPNDILDNDEKNVSISNFINKELIHFSNNDILRSIPNIVDGFKPSQRKIIYGCLESNLDKNGTEMKVSQISGKISALTSYHHGEMSLQGAIINLAQDYMGSNNINLLNPIGQFGTRLMSGHDSASCRYIFTSVNPILKYIIRKEDQCILEDNYDDGLKIEPKSYLPIIPLILVNGAIGIGTGFSCNIPSYNIKEIINIIENKILNKHNSKDIIPYFRKFKGSVKKIDDQTFELSGNFHRKNKELIISELYPGLSTQSYKEHLMKLEETKKILSFTDNNTDEEIYFTIKMNKIPENDEEIFSLFKLKKNIKTTNMHLFTSNYKGRKSHIKKYESTDEIINDFLETRLEAYQDRKDCLLQILEEELLLLKNKIRFISSVINDEIIVYKVPENSLIKILKEKEFYSCPKQKFDYLINISVRQLCQDNIEKLTSLYQKKNEFYDTYKNTSIQDIYLDELQQLKQNIKNF